MKQNGRTVSEKRIAQVVAQIEVFSWHLLVGSEETDERLQSTSGTSLDENSNKSPDHMSAA